MYFFTCKNKMNLIQCTLLWVRKLPNTIKEVSKMAKCSVCDKGAHFGNAVSHSHRRSNKMWKSNVKSVRVNVNGATKKIYVCTSCLRSGKVERA